MKQEILEMFFELEYDEDNQFGEDTEKDLGSLLETCYKNIEVFGEEEEKLIEKAFYYCVEKHKGIKRRSGKLYYTHPLRVAEILLTEFPTHDANTVAACLLHDTIEDVEDVTKSIVAKEFNQDIAEMVDSVTKISHDNTSKTQNKAHTYRKIFLSLVKDIRVVLIKLADRLHNVRTLHYLKPEKQKTIALETLNFYTPLAHRLGLGKIKMHLENLSFFYTDKEAYEAIKEALVIKRKEFLSYINMFTDHIEQALNKAYIDHTLTVVHKHEYEIYKMLQQGKSLSDIDNFYSIVIVIDTNDVSECYMTHGILANAFNTIKFIDHISNPTISWFRSIMSEIYGPDGKKVEILIRTQEMEKIAEDGFSASYSLKDGRIKALEISDKQLDDWGEWMEHIINTKGETATQIIWNSIKVNIFDSDLTVYNKEGKQFDLPKGATLLDYAFLKSPNKGLHFVKGKVNGVIKDISYKLQQGDQIEIISSKNAFPHAEWQKYIVTQNAIVCLFKFFNQSGVTPSYDDDVSSSRVEVSLKITGDDKEQLLHEITQAVGQTNMKRVNIDTTAHVFEGTIDLSLKNEFELNKLFVDLFRINGIKGVEKIEELSI